MNAFRSKVLLLSVVTLATLAACNRSPTDASAIAIDMPADIGMSAASSGNSAPAIAESDRAFMMKAAGDGLSEVEISKYAAQNASNLQVKAFAAMLPPASE